MENSLFNLCVNDFGIEYIGIKNLQHLYDALRKETYKIVEDYVVNYIVAYLSSGISRNDGLTHQWHSML